MTTNPVAFIGEFTISGTSGSIIFVDSTTALAQDNTNLKWNAGSTRLEVANLLDSGLSASLPVYTDASKILTSTAPTSGAIGYWSRSSPTLIPTTANDIVSITSNSGSTAILTTNASAIATNQGHSFTTTIVSTNAVALQGALFTLSNTPSTNANTASGIQITQTDGTTLANTNYGLNISVALTGNAAKVGYGVNAFVSTSSTTADTIAGFNFQSQITGAISTGIRAAYGSRSIVQSTAVNSGGTANLYGAYGSVSMSGATTSSTTNAYGGWFGNTTRLTTGGTLNSYGVYIANDTQINGTGTTTQTGLYVESITGADTNYAGIFAGTGARVGIGNSAPGSNLAVGPYSSSVNFYMTAGGDTTHDAAMLALGSGNGTGNDGTISTGTAFAMSFFPDFSITGNLTAAYGINQGLEWSNPDASAHTITTAYGYRHQLLLLARTGAINVTTNYGFYIAAPFNGAGGTITNSYAFVSESGAGNWGIGTVTPAALLHVNGTVRVDGQNSTGTNIPTIGTNKPGSAVSLTPNTWLKVNIGGTDNYIPCWI